MYNRKGLQVTSVNSRGTDWGSGTIFSTFALHFRDNPLLRLIARYLFSFEIYMTIVSGRPSWRDSGSIHCQESHSPSVVHTLYIFADLLWMYTFTMLITFSSIQKVHGLCQSRPCAIYTECNRRNGPDFWRVFLRSYYIDITQNTYIQSSLVTEILAREVWNFDSYYSLIDYQIHIETGRNMWFL